MAVFLTIPGDGSGWSGGGLFTVQRLARIIGAELVTTHQVSSKCPDLEAVLLSAAPSDLFVVSWGPHVPDLLERLVGRRVMYWANSLGWEIQVPPSVPVLCASRFTMGHWGEDAPASPLYFLPNPLDESFRNRGLQREIDVLVMKRKTSANVLEHLVPRLRSEGVRVEVSDTHVDDISLLFNTARIFVYDSREYWTGRGVSEGFGLPPLEALACGCIVFTSMNAGISDYADPPNITRQIGVYGLGYDTAAIMAALNMSPPDAQDVEARLAPHRADAIAARWRSITSDLEPFWNHEMAPTLVNPPFMRQYSRPSPPAVSAGNRIIRKLRSLT